MPESGADAVFDSFVHQTVDDWRGCAVSTAVRAMLAYAEKLTREAASCTAEDVDALRKLQWSDSAIHDAVQVVAYFNYINRIADALGVDMESGLPMWGHPEANVNDSGK